MTDIGRWIEAHTLDDSYDPHILPIVQAVRALPECSATDLHDILRRCPKPAGGAFSKNHIVQSYRRMCAAGVLPFERETLRRLQMKPTRTISGVTPVTVLTKPYPCPGKCIFCPTDVRMPKSYLHDEPGAMRAEQHQFDPFAQTAARIETFESLGHSAAKVELLILGGTWSSYRRDYQEWFIQRCLDAMNGCDSSSLEEAQRWNETAAHRNVGLVVETRPDHVTWDEIRWLRRLGVTKVQMGAQSLDDQVLEINQRGHSVEETRQAVTLLRAAGFKIALHWMPNLLGATPEADRADFRKLWDDEALRPDELKIYPCSLLANAELYLNWQRGEYHPYTEDELTELIVECKRHVPRYCRINRVIRDIPASNVVAGSTRSNLRQDVHRVMRERGLRCNCLRCREVRGTSVDADELRLAVETYATRVGMEHFVSLVTDEDRVAGFVRLSLPSRRGRGAGGEGELPEIAHAGMIRELHVYGPSLELGDGSVGEAQHIGLGTRLLAQAERRARAAGYGKLAVIAAIGTREYDRERGFAVEGLYMTKVIPSTPVAREAVPSVDEKLHGL
ncbi:MAG: tRNA uridine(34) 5-carboxymethylaminomethyl modification radical SAM/GNAT enzyme Elp3 [Chloroflexi bacterium]|nr:tRNA uridine(34) 5-carboxymethylaminomethyl modification radical SAM/GNAT enzyme Elp3 [Chloroflexota bacterium]